MKGKRFHNRKYAGAVLARKLRSLRDAPNTIVLGLSRGGITVAAEIADRLHQPADVFVSRKLSVPEHPEYALGAVTETGVVYVDMCALCQEPWIHEELRRYLECEIQSKKRDVARRCQRYRGGRVMRDLTRLTVILVDEGAFSGATFLAAVQSLRKLGVKKIVAAVPVVTAATVRLIRDAVDEVVILLAPEDLRHLSSYYDDFSEVTDEQVVQCLTELGTHQKLNPARHVA